MNPSDRRSFLRKLGTGVVALSAAGSGRVRAHAAETSFRPNVLFIFADDQREDTIGALGNSHIQTPNLDALVRNGTVFSNAYCMGGFSAAVCMPSRMMALRGRSWFSVQDLPPGFPNFPTSMNEGGYQTFHLGKRGNSDLEVQALFGESHYIQPSRPPGKSNQDADNLVREEGTPGKQLADGAIAFLRGRDRGKPFFMYLAGPEPHDPRVAPNEYLAKYPVENIPLPPNYLPFHPFDNGELLIRDERLAAWPRTESEIRGHIRDYYATITYFDEQLGRLFDTLKELGEYENTIIVFASDQGIALGSHGLMGKQNLYEHSMGAPLIFSGPGIPNGRRCDAFAYLFDVFPTVCELAGLPVPAGLDGKSLAPVIHGERDSVCDTIFLAYKDVQRAVRCGQWKLIRYPHIDKTQLFDLDADPFETHDLAAYPAQADRMKALMDLMAEQQKLFGDHAPLSVEHPKPAKVDLAFFKKAEQ